MTAPTASWPINSVTTVSVVPVMEPVKEATPGVDSMADVERVFEAIVCGTPLIIYVFTPVVQATPIAMTTPLELTPFKITEPTVMEPD